jgi:hypothetical protein
MMLWSTGANAIILVTSVLGGALALDPDDILPWQVTDFFIYKGSHAFYVSDLNNLTAVQPDGNSTIAPRFPPTKVYCKESNGQSTCDPISSGNWTFKILYSNFDILQLNLTEAVTYEGSTYYKTFVAEGRFGSSELYTRCGGRSCYTAQKRSSTPVLLTPKLVDCKGEC